jgi:hypothetical protein
MNKFMNKEECKKCGGYASVSYRKRDTGKRITDFSGDVNTKVVDKFKSLKCDEDDCGFQEIYKNGILHHA